MCIGKCKLEGKDSIEIEDAEEVCAILEEVIFDVIDESDPK